MGPPGPRPSSCSTPCPKAPSHLSHASKQENHTCASVLLVGTSMVRHVAIHGGRTFCHPGAWVKEVTSSALQLSEQHCPASTMVQHLWLTEYCLMKSIPFVDNFFVFLNRPHLFKSNGLHPNQEGLILLSVNINLTVRSCTTTTS